MERGYDSDDTKDEKKPAPRAPVPVSLGRVSREGGMFAGPAPEKPKIEVPPAKLSEAAITLFERQNVIRPPEIKDEDEDDEETKDDDDATTMPVLPQAIKSAPAEKIDDLASLDDKDMPIIPPAPNGQAVPRPTAELNDTDAVYPVPSSPSPQASRPFQFADLPRVKPAQERVTESPLNAPRPIVENQPPQVREQQAPPAAETWSRPSLRRTEVTAPSPTATLSETSTRYSNEYYSIKREMAGNFITSVALSWYLSHRGIKKHERREEKVHTAMRQQTEQVAQNQERIQQRFARYTAEQQRIQALKEAEPPRKQLTSEQVAAIQKQLEQPPDETKVRIEQDAWKRNVFVNGKLEQESVDHGRAFYEEQRAEQAGNRFTYGSGQSQGRSMAGQAPVMPPSPTMPMLDSGQVDPSYQLPASRPPTPDIKHLLEPPQSHVVDAFKDPWIWAGVGVLLFAFLAAAFL